MSRIACMLATSALTVIPYSSVGNAQVVSTPKSTSPRLAPKSPSPTTELLATFRSEFVEITPGTAPFPSTFTMGNSRGPEQERPSRSVTMRKTFWIAKYEVTQELWQAVIGSNPSRWKGPRNSVEELSFNEAQEFCRQMTQLLRSAKQITETQTIRLPTEAEWEYCARAGTTTAYSHGDNVAQLDEYAWHTGNAAGNDPPVGAKKPNPWGLYDMHGYLSEWCLDAWHPNYQGAPENESVWTTDKEVKKRVLRSGSWKDDPRKLTSSSRIGLPPDTRDDAIGLRCVLTN